MLELNLPSVTVRPIILYKSAHWIVTKNLNIDPKYIIYEAPKHKTVFKLGQACPDLCSKQSSLISKSLPLNRQRNYDDWPQARTGNFRLPEASQHWTTHQTSNQSHQVEGRLCFFCLPMVCPANAEKQMSSWLQSCSYAIEEAHPIEY